MRRLGLLLLATCLSAAFTVACGGASSKPPPPPVAGEDAATEIPPDATEQSTVDAGVVVVVDEDAGFDPGITRRDAATPYPSGPFGTAVGDIVPNIRLYGYPLGSSKDPSNTWKEVSLAQYWDPDGTKGPSGVPNKTLFVDVSARWCSYCKLEAETLDEKCKERAAKGLVCYTSIFQDDVGKPATRADINYWKDTFGLEFAVTVDPAFQWGIFFPQEATPLNLFIDLKTMRVAGMCFGADEKCITESIENFTRCPVAVCPNGQVCALDGKCTPK